MATSVIFLQKLFVTVAIAAIFSLPGYVFLNLCWRTVKNGIKALDVRFLARIDWPVGGSCWMWRRKHQWRVIIYGAPDHAVPSSTMLTMQSFQRLAAWVLGATGMSVVVLFVGVFWPALIPLAVWFFWVLFRTPPWPKKPEDVL